LFHAERQAENPTKGQTYGRKDELTDTANLIAPFSVLRTRLNIDFNIFLTT